MSGQRIRSAAICLLLCCLVPHAYAAGVSSDEWVTRARQATPAQFAEKHVVSVDDNCAISIQKGDVSLTAGSPGGTVEQTITATAGVGTIIEFCGGATKPQIFKAPDFFATAAIWKVESKAGYVEGDYLVECQANPNSCCTVYLVPVAAGPYTIDVESCPSVTAAVSIEKGTILDTLAAPLPVMNGTMSQNEAIDLELSLVFRPDCGLGAPSDEGADGVYEGTGESQSTEEGADGVYEGTGESQSPSPDEGADGIYEGNGESQSPSPDEGADGIYEGNGESQSPSPDEGADGIYEGNGESQSPSPDEGADGIYEGNGESQSPSPDEGADGIYEGNGESMASPPEGADGVYEGTGEGSTEGADGIYEGTGESMSPPPSVEGADGVYEGNGEAMSPPSVEGSEGGTGRRLMQSENDASASANPGTKWFWSKGHTFNKNSLIDPAAPTVSESVESGESGEGGRRLLWRNPGTSRSLLDATTGVPMYDAVATPIELVAGVLYKMKINMVRAPQAAYFSAPEFFDTCLVHHVEDAGSVVEFGRLRDVEVYQGSAYWAIEVQPTKPGTYTFSSNADGPDGVTGTIKVVGTAAELSNSTAFATQDVSISPCSTVNSAPPGTPGTPGTPGVSGAARGALNVLGSIIAAVALAVALL